MKTICEIRSELSAYCYNDNGRSRGARLKRDHLIANGFSEHVLLVESTTNILPEEYTFSKKLAIFVKDKVIVPQCKTCGTVIFKWLTGAGDWSKYCNQRCVQNDPDVKQSVKDGLATVDWGSAVQKRESTMTERYGVASYAETEASRNSFGARTSLAWQDPELAAARLSARRETNLEKYGVEHSFDRPDQRKKNSVKANATKSKHSQDRRELRNDRYRASICTPEAFRAITSKSEMHRLYVTEDKAIIEIANELNVHTDAISYALRRFGIPLNPEKESPRLKSVIETTVFKFVHSLRSDAIQGTRLGRKQMDIFVPSLNLVIEFNGVYWHSEAKVPTDYHNKKMSYFTSAGMRYVQIWEDDWRRNQEVVKKFITNLLGKNSSRIGARQTQVVELTQVEFDSFMDSNHMLGSTRAGIRLGLVKDGTIVAAMGFKRTRDRNYDLNRFANTSVAGAFSKLLAYFERNFDFDEISSFADLELVDANSNVYSKHGFVESYRLSPDYRYFNYRTGLREHKFGWRKQRFESLGYDISSKTERELAKEHKLLRCYDSGKICYIKQRD